MRLSERLARLEGAVTPRERIEAVTMLSGPYFPPRSERTAHGAVWIWVHETDGLPAKRHANDPAYKVYGADLTAMVSGEREAGAPMESRT